MKKISQDAWVSAKKYVKLSTGIKMAYVEMGDPDGEVVILQHGMTDNSRSWSLAAPYFAEAGYHVYLPDLRGMGKSDAPDGIYGIETYATDLEAFFDAMDIDQAIVIGHSLGSFVAQDFCLMFPERCSKLVLVSSIPVRGIQNEMLDKAYHGYIEPLAEDEHPSDDFMDFWYACEPKEEGIQDVFDSFISNLKKESQCLSRATWKNIIFGMMASNSEMLYQEYDPDIPVLILHGEEDTMTTTKYQQELSDLFDVSADSFRNYDGVGHNIQFEIPEQSSKDILGWLETGTLPE